MPFISSLFRVSAFALVVTAFLLASPQSARAQAVVGGAAGTEGSTFEFRILSNASAVVQTVYSASALSSFLSFNDTITGIAFRLDGAATAGTPALNFADYEIYLGGASSSLSADFASNYSGTRPRTKVRDGALSFSAGAFQPEATSAPAAFGPTIAFDSPYTYKGGDLVIEIRHSGNGTTNLNVDGTLSGAFGALTWNNVPSDANGGTPSNNPITRLSVGAPAVVPEAGTGALLALAALPALGAVITRRSAQPASAGN